MLRLVVVAVDSLSVVRLAQVVSQARQVEQAITQLRLVLVAVARTLQQAATVRLAKYG
jgi:hypothetical protein